MTKLTAEQLAAIDRVQADQDPNATPEDRIDFMRRIVSVKPADLEAAPMPPKAKRGRPSKPSPGVSPIA